MQIRIGLNSGEVVVRSIGSDLHMEYTAVGQTTYLAAQMERLARPGATLLTAETRRLAEGYVAVTALGPVPVRGLAEPIEVYELTGPGPARYRLQAATVRGLSRFVGRESEVARAARRPSSGPGPARGGWWPWSASPASASPASSASSSRGRGSRARSCSRAARSRTGRPRRGCR